MSSASTGGTEGSSPASSPASAASLAMAAPKFGTLVPNRIFVGGISASTSEAELAQLFSAYGNVKATKIISDRAGVSKGYGFVTFETDAEARRLQQESECIILRERKLNIAPAIKKQPFNRSFDGGSGSPPAVPTSTYYYANGMGLTYQNGLTFYNTGAPAPGTPIAPPADPTIYTPAGVFGPQATSGHQTFAPVVYSCPAPSLYMPQQYQYSPMTYESYYTGAAGGGGPPQYALYTTSATSGTQQQQHQSQTQNNSSVAGSGGGSSVGGGSSIGGNGTGAGSPPALTSMPPPSTHFYAPSAPPPPPPHHHHHPPVAAGPPPPHPQLDHLYYSFAAPGPPPVPPQQQHQTIGIGDQQLLLYTTDPTSCQQLNATSDSQPSAQEDTRSTSSHSDHPQQHSDTQQQQQSQQSQLSTTPLMSLMPIKYPIMSARYASYHPLAMHPGNVQHSQHTLNQHGSQTMTNGSNQSSLNSEQIEETGSPSPLQRSQAASAPAYLYPATVYIPHGTGYQTTTGPTVGASLLPTPGSTYESPLKIHQNPAMSGKAGLGNAALGINLGYRTHNNYTILGGIQQQSYAKNQGHPRKYGSYQGGLNSNDRGRFYGNKGGPALSQYSYVTSRPGVFGNQILTNASHFGANAPTSSYNGQSYNSRRNSSDQWSDSYESFKYGTSRRRDASIHSRSSRNASRDDTSQNETKNSLVTPPSGDARLNDENPTKALISVTDRNKSPASISNNNNNNSPPPAPYSPMTRPIPNISPPISQVHIYPSGGQVQNRYHHLQMSHHQPQQHQQSSGQRRYGGLGQSMNSGRKPPGSGSQVGQGSGEILRRPKSKVNGLMQGGIGKHQDDNCLGGGGDATGSNISRMPITPPSTPRNNNSSNNDANPIGETCHQMQALTL